MKSQITRNHYKAEWKAQRRADFLRGKSCAVIDCGNAGKLVLHHLDPKTKVDHRIWSWNQERREAELRKCIVICETHHYAAHKGLRNYGKEL